MLSKHWDHPTVYPMILKLLITRGNITLIPKEATPEKEKENLKLQPEKLTEVCHFGHFWLSYGRSAMSGSPKGRSEGST